VHGVTPGRRYHRRVLAWMDLEMTGLDPDRHVIVEIATLITDDDLELVAEGPDLVIHQPPAALAHMDDYVREMHTRSGLLTQIDESVVTPERAAAETLAFLRTHIPEARSVPLCGNSIGTDRRFLARWFPEIEDFLHYRSVDVSTLKELARRWYPDTLPGAPKKARGHRAMDDIRESLDELRYYRSALFHSAAAVIVPPTANPTVAT
jgi:oligoribonuclease